MDTHASDPGREPSSVSADGIAQIFDCRQGSPRCTNEVKQRKASGIGLGIADRAASRRCGRWCHRLRRMDWSRRG